MLALHVTHVLDPMTPYIVVPWHTVVCVCVCVPNTSTALLALTSTVSIAIYYRHDVGCHGF